MKISLFSQVNRFDQYHSRTQEVFRPSVLLHCLGLSKKNTVHPVEQIWSKKTVHNDIKFYKLMHLLSFESITITRPDDRPDQWHGVHPVPGLYRHRQLNEQIGLLV